MSTLLDQLQEQSGEHAFIPAGIKELLREAKAEIERLQAIVDKLPTTADGVPVLVHESPRIWVFTKRTGLYRSGEKTQWWQMRVDRFKDGFFHGYVDGSHMDAFPASECYSTSEEAITAAEAEPNSDIPF